MRRFVDAIHVVLLSFHSAGLSFMLFSTFHASCLIIFSVSISYFVFVLFFTICLYTNLFLYFILSSICLVALHTRRKFYGTTDRMGGKATQGIKCLINNLAWRFEWGDVFVLFYFLKKLL